MGHDAAGDLSRLIVLGVFLVAGIGKSVLTRMATAFGGRAGTVQKSVLRPVSHASVTSSRVFLLQIDT